MGLSLAPSISNRPSIHLVHATEGSCRGPDQSRRIRFPCRVRLAAWRCCSLCAWARPRCYPFTDRRIDTELRARKTSVTPCLRPMPSLRWHFSRSYLKVWEVTCPKQRNPRSGSIGHARYRCWGLPGCRCRWRAEHPRYPLAQQRACRRRTPKRVAATSLSVRRKSLMFPWRHSMFSTGRTSDHLGRACN
jgi:hypothetical protein